MSKRYLYAFDCDHTLDVPGWPETKGPVELNSLVQLHEDGHIVGICGNWAVLVNCDAYWYKYINFIGPMGMTKPDFLGMVKRYTQYNKYIFVGNDPANWEIPVSEDKLAAEECGYHFISEYDFAKGAR